MAKRIYLNEELDHRDELRRIISSTGRGSVLLAMDVTLEEQHLLLRLRQLANEIAEDGKPAVLVLSVSANGNIKWHETN